jgi:hypothetical protein
LFSGKAEIRINPEALHRKVGASTREAQAWLDHAIIRETRPFVPKDQSVLMASVDSPTEYGPVKSRIGSGLLVWATPYARRLYYGITFNFARDKNPKATHHWFEKAKSIHLTAWGQGVAKILNGFWRRGA